MDRRNLTAALASIVFFALACIYFIPAANLREILPGIVVKYRIIGPLAALTLAGAALIPWQMTLAMGFSLAGDFMGAYGCFIGQMGFFALAHIMLITWLAGRLRQGGRICKGAVIADAAAVAFLVTFALTCIIPHAPAGVIRTGCAVYAILICSMFGLALLQRSLILAAGAALFLLSDMILSWNKFVSPVENSRWLIMVPYYAWQILLWTGAFKARK